MDETEQDKIQLSTQQKKTLRGLAHHLKPQAYIGKEGITDNLIKAVRQALTAHELIKVKLGPNCPLAKQQAAEEIANHSSSILVQLIGKMVIIYRPNDDLPKEKQIKL